MGPLYVVLFQSVTVTAAQDLFEIPVLASRTRIVHEICITQHSEIKDAESEMLRYTLMRGVGHTSGSGGSTPAAQALNSDSPAFGSTPEVNNTTRAAAGGGSITTLFEWDEHIANGLHYLPTPELWVPFKDDEAIIVGLEDAPADTMEMTGFIVIQQI